MMTYRFFPRLRRHLLAALLFFAAGSLLSGGFALPAAAQGAAQATAQDGTQSSPENSPDTNAAGPAQNRDFISQKTANSQNLAKAEQEDEEYVFKHSASVRAIGRIFHLSPEAASSVFWGLNFLILAGFVGYFLVKLLPKTFRERRHAIEKQLIEARMATEQANERLRAVEERLGRLDAEIAAVRAHAEAESAGDEARIRATIEDERKKIIASAEQEIAAAAAAAQRRLRRFAAELAIDRATARLDISEDADRALVREFARGLDGRAGGGLGGDGRNGGRN
jgi:F-type H+-transporting ATPase subunit b